jgi:pimeloyl-ACP methyl ester carboxylesterase
MRALHSALPHSELRILANQGHLATHTAPELLAREIISFLDR